MRVYPDPISSNCNYHFGRILNSQYPLCRIKSAGKLKLFSKALLYFLCQKNSTEMCDWLLNGSLRLISVQNSIAKLKEHEITSHSPTPKRGRVRGERKLDEEKEEEIGVNAKSLGKFVHVSAAVNMCSANFCPSKCTLIFVGTMKRHLTTRDNKPATTFNNMA